MRLQSLLKKSLFIVVPILSIVSCKKGDTGPAGPAGTANVIYSAWFTPAAWIKDTVFNVYGFNYNKAAADITQKVLDSGTVITFGMLAGYNTAIWPTGQVAQLPIVLNYKFSSAGITYTDTWSALATVGNLKIKFVDDQNYYSSIATAHQFRYIIIPGGQKSTSSLKQGAISASGKQISAEDLSAVSQHYQEMSYAEVCQRLGVPE